MMYFAIKPDITCMVLGKGNLKTMLYFSVTRGRDPQLADCSQVADPAKDFTKPNQTKSNTAGCEKVPVDQRL